MNLAPLPAYSDNDIWMPDDGARAVMADPAPVQQTPDKSGLELAEILVTHHHADNIGGVKPLRARLQGPVPGPARGTVPTPCDATSGLAALREWKNQYR